MTEIFNGACHQNWRKTMKTFNKALLAIAASSVLAVSANAAVSYGANSVGQPYVGVKVGKLKVDDVPNATGYGVYGGYNFDQNFGVEAEYIGSEDKDLNNNQAEYNIKSYGLYGTYRYNFANTPIYGKAKLGVARTEGEIESKNGNFKEKEKDTRVAGGVGVGYQATQNLGIEASYSYLDSDVDMWGVGAHLSF